VASSNSIRFRKPFIGWRINLAFLFISVHP
jgi:hypothetical protein